MRICIISSIGAQTYQAKYEEASKWINGFLNEVSLKKFQMGQLEVKCILALQYCLLKEFDLFHQLINSIQRQIRMIGKDKCRHIVLFTKILKISLSEAKRNKFEKISGLVDKLNHYKFTPFTPTLMIKMNEKLILKLSEE